MKARISACSARQDSYWDYKTCRCRLKKTTRECIADSGEGGTSVYRTINIFCYTSLGSCITLAIFLACTTWQYRKRFKTTDMNLKLGQNKI